MKKINRDIISAFSLISQVGLLILISVLIGLFIGKFLDNLFNTSPWFLFIFIIIGILSGFKATYDITIKKKE